MYKFPFGAMTTLNPVADEDDLFTCEITNMKTRIVIPELAGDSEITLTAGADLEEGAEVIIDVADNGANDLAMGDNIVAPGLTGVADDRDTITLTYLGGQFVGGAWAKVVDAA